MKKNGTTLIELLIYLTLFTIMTMVMMHWVVHLWHTCMQYEKMRTSLINLTAAHDLFVYDIYYAPSAKIAWKVQTAHCLIWHQNEKDIGWLYEQGKLFRIEGMYQESQAIWRKKTKNIVASSMKNVTFTCHGDTEIAWIDIHMIDTYHTIDTRILLAQRYIPWNIKMDPLPL